MSSANEDYNSSSESIDLDTNSILPNEKRSGEEAESILKSSRNNESKAYGSMSSPRKAGTKTEEDRRLQLLELLMQSDLNNRTREEINFLLPYIRKFKVLKVKTEDNSTQEDILWAICQNLKVIKVEQDEYVYHYGDKGLEMYILLQGNAYT